MAAPRMRIETGSAPTGESQDKPELVAEPSPEVRAEEAEAPVAEVKETDQPVEQKARVVATVVEEIEVEPEPEPDVVQPTAKDSSQEETSKGASGEGESKKGSRLNMRDWVRKTFPGHEGAFWGAIIALIIALLIFMIGFFRVLLIIVLVIVGIALGQYIDGDPKIIRAITRLFKRDREDW